MYGESMRGIFDVANELDRVAGLCNTMLPLVERAWTTKPDDLATLSVRSALSE